MMRLGFIKKGHQKDPKLWPDQAVKKSKHAAK